MENMNRTTDSFECFGQHIPSDKPVRLAWLDQLGQIRCVAGRCIDISTRRIHLVVPEQIPLHSRVILRTGERHIAGSAVVKYVTHYDTRFILVLDIG